MQCMRMLAVGARITSWTSTSTGCRATSLFRHPVISIKPRILDLTASRSLPSRSRTVILDNLHFEQTSAVTAKTEIPSFRSLIIPTKPPRFEGTLDISLVFESMISVSYPQISCFLWTGGIQRGEIRTGGTPYTFGLLSPFISVIPNVGFYLVIEHSPPLLRSAIANHNCVAFFSCTFGVQKAFIGIFLAVSSLLQILSISG